MVGSAESRSAGNIENYRGPAYTSGKECRQVGLTTCPTFLNHYTQERVK